MANQEDALNKGMKKALIITYYWPPTGGAGVQRWLKFVKYLRSFGWEPIVYTPLNPEAPETDESLLKDVPENVSILKQPIWEPYLLYKKFIGKGKKEKIQAAFLSEKKRNPLTEKISVWIRGNLFIPDARKFWIKPSTKFLKQYLKEHPVDVIISTGPPHSMHLIAMKIASASHLPWIADFRDPWTNIDFYKDLMLTAHADRRHHKLELSVLTHACSVISISKSMADDFFSIHPRHYDVITNGYDEADLDSNVTVQKDLKFSIAHIGTLVNTRNPHLLWSVLKEIADENPPFKGDLSIKLVGRVDFSVEESIQENGLSDYLERISYMPHNDVVKVQQSSQVLLLLINNTPNAKSILTGKFFEYLSAKRPILCIGPTDGDAAAILSETQSGLISGFTDREKLKANILTFYTLYKENNLMVNSQNIEKYSRKALTEQLVAIINRISA